MFCFFKGETAIFGAHVVAPQKLLASLVAFLLKFSLVFNRVVVVVDVVSADDRSEQMVVVLGLDLVVLHLVGPTFQKRIEENVEKKNCISDF